MLLEVNTFYMFNEYSQYIIYWLFIFCVFSFFKISYKIITQGKTYLFDEIKLTSHKENLFLEELPGLTFILLHTLCWYLSKNLLTKIFFLYWGPMYLVTAYLVLFYKNIKWKTIAISSSILCKFFYVFFVLIFGYMKLYVPIYCYSVWIMHDQVKLAWLKSNADRTRRFFEDYFIFRLGYPLFLLIPFFDNTFYLRNLSIGVSSLLLLFWIIGIFRIVVAGKFFDKPKIEGFGRDIVYL